jgi:hypothetical protein
MVTFREHELVPATSPDAVATSAGRVIACFRRGPNRPVGLHEAMPEAPSPLSLRTLDASQPGLAPVRIDRPRAGAMVDAPADDAVEDHGVAPDPQHPPGLLVDDFLDPAQHPRPPSAVLEHLRVEPKSLRLVVLVQRREDLFPALDLDDFARLQAK